MKKTTATIRNIDPELAQRLKAIGTERGESLNSTLRHLPRDAVGLDARRERLLRYTTWTADDLDEFNVALNAQRVVDESCWR